MEIPISDDYKIRPWSWDDTDALVKYANNRKIWLNLRDAFPSPYTRSDARSWLRAVVDERPLISFAIASEDEAIGGIGMTPQFDVKRKSAEIGYWLAEPFWGKGIATEATRALVDYAFNFFDVIRLYAHVFDWNPASGRVLEKAGFELEARHRKGVIKDGKVMDELVYALLREPSESD